MLPKNIKISISDKTFFISQKYGLIRNKSSWNNPPHTGTHTHSINTLPHT